MKQKTFYILVAVIITGFLLYYYWDAIKAKFATKINPGGTPEPSPSGENGSTSTDWSKLLKIGSEGHEVYLLQMQLNNNGANPKLATDGIFGMKTESALMAETGFKQISLNQFKAEHQKNKPWIPLIF